MSRLPIKIEKIKIEDSFRKESVNYLVTIEEKGTYWKKSVISDRGNLLHLRDRIDELLGESTTAEILGISENDSQKIDSAHANDPLCKSCNLKMTQSCITCILTLQSPLERKVYVELINNKIKFDTQVGLNWQGQRIHTINRSYNHPTNNFKDVLTIVDFVIRKGKSALCIYTDGHSFHERTEEHAQRDRKIDRTLQELGYTVFRYPGKDVHENMDRIISEIENWINNAE